MAVKVDILADGLHFPEGPAFDGNGDIWCVELKGEALVHIAGGKVRRYVCGGAPNGIAIDQKGLIWFCDADKSMIRRFDPQNGKFENVVDMVGEQRLDAPNDLAFDSGGNLIFTCPGNSRKQPTGYVCCLKPNGNAKKIADGMYFPNGLALMDGDHSLVIVETYKNRLWYGSWSAKDRTWSEPKTGENVGGCPGPDGIAIGKDGLIYVAIYGEGMIKAVERDGKVVKSFALPGMNPTNVAFDSSGKLGLIVTETEKGQLLSLPELGPGVQLYG
jgi:gluconolactonase